MTKPAPLSLAQHSGVPTTIAVTVIAFGGWSLLLPVVPLATARAGGSDLLVGATTGVFMACTVILQIMAPALIARCGYRLIMVVGTALLGLPALLHLWSLAAVPVLTTSGIRGAGFGLLTVACSALIAELVPTTLLGSATGALGVAIGVSQTVMLPGGLALAKAVDPDAVFLVTAIVGVVGTVVAFRLPATQSARLGGPESEPSVTGGRVSAIGSALGLFHKLGGPALIMLSAAMGFGAITTFLPLSLSELHGSSGADAATWALGVVGALVILGRYGSGKHADRFGPGKLLLPGLCASAIGMAIAAFAEYYSAGSWCFIAAAAFFGLGFGIVQNESLLLSFARVRRGQLTTASAVWNIAFDGGTGLGSLLLAPLAFWGYFAVFGGSTVFLIFVSLWLIAHTWRSTSLRS